MSSKALISSITSVLEDPVGDHGDTGRQALRLLEKAGWLPADRSSQGLVIGIDLGGTKLLASMGSADGRLLAEVEEPTEPSDPLTQISSAIETLLSEQAVSTAQVARVVVGVPGAVAPDGRVLQSPHVQFPADRSFAEALSGAIHIPVLVENDVNLAAFGEYSVRGKPAGAHLAFVALGTGIGMGLIVNGALLRGANGAAGEISGMPYNGIPAAGLAENTYEARVSTQGIRDRHVGPAGSVRAIFGAAEAGDAQAAQTIEGLLDDLSMGFATIVALLDPGLIVLGGGIGARPGIAEAMSKRLAAMVAAPCVVEVSRLGARAGLIGALAFARHHARLDLLARLDDQEGAAA